MPYKHHYYLEPATQVVVRIRAKRKPSLHTRPHPSRCWVVEEYLNGDWSCTGETTWYFVSRLTYIGTVPVPTE